MAEIFNTQINANADFSGLISQVRAAVSELTVLQKQFGSAGGALSQNVKRANADFADILRNSGQFTSQFVTISGNIDKFGRNLDAGRLKLKDYYRTWQDYHRNSASMVKELAKQQVALQNSILQPMGRNARGQMQFNLNIPTGIDELRNKTALAKKELSIMNKVMQDGSIQLINWGKNTQWAGRQLTVGLTVPIAAFGKAAADAFKVADQELTRLTKVYGGLAATSTQDLNKVREEVAATARDLSASYGVSFKDTIALAADIAATGKEGQELLKSLQETTRLSVLGEVDRQESMKATLAIQNAFKQNTDELAESINFLNAVENQTSTTLQDLVEAIPKAGPIIRGLGGSVEDLALYLTAMKEGGVDAASAANGLKSALGSLINPTKIAKGMFADFGIDLESIVVKNAGNLTATILELQSSLEKLNPLQKQQALEQLFGKYQFARMGALFDNLGKQGSQTIKVLDLMRASTQEIGAIANRELTMITESASGRYRRALESLRADLAVVGEDFLNVATKIIQIADKTIQFFNKLPEPVKKFLTILGGFTAIAGPIIMLTGVFANFIGYVFKGLTGLRSFFSGAKTFQYITPEIIAAEKAASMFGNTLYSDAAAAKALESALLNLSASMAQLKGMSSGTILPPDITGGAGTARRVPRPRNPGGSGSIMPGANFGHIVPQAGMSAQEKAAQTFFYSVPFSGDINNAWSTRPQPMGMQGMPMVEGVTSIGGRSAAVNVEAYARYQSMLVVLSTKTKRQIQDAVSILNMTGRLPEEFLLEFQQVLPGIQRLASNAAAAATQISRQAQSGIITSQQAIMQIEAANRAMLAQLELMAINQFGVPAARLRMVPGTNQALYSRSPGGRATYNAKAFFRTGEGRMGDVALPMSQQFGIPLTPEGYQYRNMGGSIFYNNGDQVPGPNVNADVVPAMLTPGEFVIRKDVAQQDPEGMRMLNDGQAMVVPVQKFQRGGTVANFIKVAMSRYASDTEYRQILRKAVEKRQSRRYSERGRERDATHVGRFGSSLWLTRGASTKATVDDYIQSLPAGQARREAASIIEQYTKTIYATGSNVKKVKDRIYRRDPNTLELEDLLEESLLNKALKENGLPTMSLQSRVHATHLTQAVVRNGKRLVSRYTADFDYLSNLQANQNSLNVSDFIARNLTSGRDGKYDRLLRAAGIPVSSRKSIESKIDERLFEFLNDKRSSKMGDFGGDIKFKDLIPFIDDIIISSGGNKAQLDALKKNVVLRANKGGMIPGYIKGGWFPKPSGGGRRGWIDYLSEILSMRRKGTIGPYLKPRRLTNDDPAHGPIQIGRYRPEIRSRLDYYPPRIEYGVTGEDVYYRGMDPYQSQIATAWPTGSTPEARAQYIADQYARGGYEIMNIPNAQAMLGAAAAKRSGTFFRGVSIPVVGTSTDGTTTIMPRFGPGGNKMLPLPEWLIKELDLAKKSGDFSRLIGKTFIMRRSSWSSNPQTARGFGDFFIESEINNRRMIPISELTPGLEFATKEGGMVPVNENEFMFGGKFIIKSAGPGGMKVASIPEIQNLPQEPGRARIYDPLERRERGGNVIANTPYLVGEKGPELFVPRMNGGIIPNDKMMKFHDGGGVPHEHLNNFIIRDKDGQLLTDRQFREKHGANAANMKRAMSGKGQGAMMLGSIAGGMAGYGLGEKVGGPMGGMIGSTAGSMLPFLIPRIFSGKNIAMIARTNLAIAAVVGTLYGLYKAYQSGQKSIQNQSLEFGLSEKAAKAAGLTYIDTAKKLSEARQNIKTSRESLQLLYINIAQAEPGKALNLTIKQLQDLKESVKKTMPDYIELINRTKDTSSLKALAINLKAQFMAAGKSAQEATQLVYALIAASDKAKFASKAIGTDGFMSVRTLQDATKVAQKAFESAQKQYEGAVAPWTKSARMKGVMDSFNTFLQAANASYEDIVKNTKLTENGTKRAVTAAEALSIQLEKMRQSGLGNVQVSQGFLNNLRNTDPILAAMVKKGDSLLTIYAKQRLILSGVTADIRELSEVEAERLSAYIGAISSGISETLDDTEGPLGKTNKRMSELDKIVKAAQKASSGFSVKQQINEREAIKLIDNKIKKINAEIDARKKALDLQKASTSYEAELAQLRLEYENAVASGNTEAAAAAKIRLSQLQQERQYALAEQALESERERRLKPLEKAKEDIQTRSQTRSDQAALSGEAGTSAQGTLTKLEKAKQEFETAYNQYRIDVSMGYYEGKTKERRAAETALLDLFKKAGGDKSFYQVKTGKTDFDQIQTFIDRINKATKTDIGSEMQGVARKFGMSVDKFEKAVNAIKGKLEELPQVKVGTTRYGGPGGVGITRPSIKKDKTTKNLKPGDVVQDSETGKSYVVVTTSGPEIMVEERKHAGGYISGPGTETSDSIPAMLSDGEYVIRASAVKEYGKEFFDAANEKRLRNGGIALRGVPTFATGGLARVIPAVARAAKGALRSFARFRGAIPKPVQEVKNRFMVFTENGVQFFDNRADADFQAYVNHGAKVYDTSTFQSPTLLQRLLNTHPNAAAIRAERAAEIEAAKQASVRTRHYVYDEKGRFLEVFDKDNYDRARDAADSYPAFPGNVVTKTYDPNRMIGRRYSVKVNDKPVRGFDKDAIARKMIQKAGGGYIQKFAMGGMTNSENSKRQPYQYPYKKRNKTNNAPSTQKQPAWQLNPYKGKNKLLSFLSFNAHNTPTTMLAESLGLPRGIFGGILGSTPADLYNNFVRPVAYSGSRLATQPENYKLKDILYDAFTVGSFGTTSKISSTGRGIRGAISEIPKIKAASSARKAQHAKKLEEYEAQSGVPLFPDLDWGITPNLGPNYFTGNPSYVNPIIKPGVLSSSKTKLLDAVHSFKTYRQALGQYWNPATNSNVPPRWYGNLDSPYDTQSFIIDALGPKIKKASDAFYSKFPNTIGGLRAKGWETGTAEEINNLRKIIRLSADRSWALNTNLYSYKNVPKNLYSDAKAGINKKVTEILEKAEKNPIGSIITKGLLYDTNVYRRLHLPPGVLGLLDTYAAVHRSNKVLGHVVPIENSVLYGNQHRMAYGPGFYQAQSQKQSDELFTGFGDIQYKVDPTFKGILRILKSKGFLTEEGLQKLTPEITEKFGGVNLGSGPMEEQLKVMQFLIDRGYLGYRHRDAIANFMVGRPGFPLRNVTPQDYIDSTFKFPELFPRIVRPTEHASVVSGIKDKENILNIYIKNKLGQMHAQLAKGGYVNSSTISKMSVPAYHLGGKVMAPYGQEILAVLQGGEKVISKEQVAASSGGGSMTNAVFNFNFDGKIHPEDRQMLMIEAVRTFETKANLKNIKTGQVRVVG